MAKRKREFQSNCWDRASMFGANMSFAAAEAYKLLRTNVMFSFVEGDCHILGVTSAVSGEGKSQTACNLAYSLAEAGKRTLLLDGDLRLPTVAEKLGLHLEPGLTNLLVSGSDFREVVQNCEEAPDLDVIAAGASSPHPAELLGSARMEELINVLSGEYEYIVVDLPPVTVVSDALMLSKLLHGVVMVVRSGVVEEKKLADAMRQLKMVDLRVLGFAYNGSTPNSGKYYKRYGEETGQ